MESQLDQFEWRGIASKDDVRQQMIDQWTAGIEITHQEEARARLQQIVLATTGLAAVLIFGLFGSSNRR